MGFTDGWQSALGPVVCFIAYRTLRVVLNKFWWPSEQPEEKKPAAEENSSSPEPREKGPAKKQKGKKKKVTVVDEKKKKKNWKSFLGMGLAMVALAATAGYSYWRYGPMFFVSPSRKKLQLTSRDWQRLLKNRTVAFVGGHHRSGTTVIWRSIAQHQKVAWFGEERFSGLDFSEGAFAQDVYPRFGVGTEFSFFSMTQKTGIGRYAMGDPKQILWTEDRATLSAQRDVLNAFGFYWQRQGGALENFDVFLEKSPPNVVLARYLQALVDLKDVSSSEPTEFPVKTVSRARFVFVTRHPIANAVSHQKFPGARWLSTPHLVAHWLAVEHYADANAADVLAFRLKLEDFAKSPVTTLLDLWRFLGLDPDQDAANEATRNVDNDPNLKYRQAYCAKLESSHTARLAHDALVTAFDFQVVRHGYRLDSFCDDGPLAPDVLPNDDEVPSHGGDDDEADLRPIRSDL